MRKSIEDAIHASQNRPNSSEAIIHIQLQDDDIYEAIYEIEEEWLLSDYIETENGWDIWGTDDAGDWRICIQLV